MKDPDVDERIILKWMLEGWTGVCINWMDLAQGRDRWRAVLNAVMNLRFFIKFGEFLE